MTFFSLENVFGFISTITTIIGILPQVYKSAITKSTTDVSAVMLVNYLICSLSWVIYGSITKSSFVITSNVIGLVAGIVAIIQKRKYG